ncbi:MAG: MATE family efflux transporter [Bacteroidales bacterium]|nr:MATE family efflux transporter [Bacteroidales bacterium]MDD2425984.1 MATE family efflux transporter [Bacteroidales bacterium]MDD3990219.1 MATE family efflux transporter [Bacteroidales bacterium]
MNKKILSLAGPSILANITVPLVGMVDVAIAGRLGDAASIGAIAIATMLFDLLYWNFGFLRVGTGGITAQAYGKRDLEGAAGTLVQAVGTALFSALFLWAIQYFFVETAFLVIDTTDQIKHFAKQYFYIRIWAAPATLSLFAIKGWFIGMQNAVSPMIVDITVNVLNLLFCLFYAIYLDMGVQGIALGTLTAQYSGVAVASLLLLVYYRKLLKRVSVSKTFRFSKMKNFFMINGNLIVRSVCFLLVYSGFTSLAAKYGETLLAVSTIMMKLMLLYSYFVDGFAYAGEALAGRYIGARDLSSLKKSIKLLFYWTMVIAVISTIGYTFEGEALFRLMTNNNIVVEASRSYLPWLIVIPVISCTAFLLDGIFIGATESKSLRDTMIVSAISFFASYYLFQGIIGHQALYLAYTVHLMVRTVMMALMLKPKVYGKLSSV